jgi:hypothetical protein
MYTAAASNDTETLLFSTITGGTLFVRLHDNDYFVGFNNFTILEVAMFSHCHLMGLFFLAVYFEAPNEKKTLLHQPE